MRTIVGLISLAMLAGCEPQLGAPSSLVTTTRVLAVRGNPPEAMPGAMVQFDTLVASPQGTVASAPAMWSYCLASLPPDDNNVVSPLCMNDSSQSPIDGPASTDSMALPTSSCEYFGPDVPSAPPGQAPQAPAVPDETGGYYQPLRVEFPSLNIDGNPAFGLERIECGLANASSDNSVQFNMTYSANNNPVLSSVVEQSGTAMTTTYATDGSATALTVSKGANVNLTALWPSSSAETFPVYNGATFTLSEQRESIQVSWFATDGSFAADRTGRASTDMTTSTSNAWTAPEEAGTAHFWVVVRDDRGGVDFGSFDLTVGM